METNEEIIIDIEYSIDLGFKLAADADRDSEQILLGDFTPFKENGNNSETINYIIQFMSLIRSQVLFPDDDTIIKLREYKFSNEVFKWFVPLADINDELIRLKKLKLEFHFSTIFNAVQSYLETKVIISIVESFGLDTSFSKNPESNVLFKHYSNFFRKRKYNRDKGKTGKMDSGDQILTKHLKGLDKVIGPDLDLETIVLSFARGEFEMTKNVFNEIRASGMSKNQLYFELFSLMKLVYKDAKLYSSEEFDDLDTLIYGGSYRKYKIARVKKILSIK